MSTKKFLLSAESLGAVSLPVLPVELEVYEAQL